MHCKNVLVWTVALVSLAACIGDEELSPDGEFEDGADAGKADGSSFSDCELEHVLALVNDPATTEATLRAAGVHTRAARNIISYRDSRDTNHNFDDVSELDSVSYVGPTAFQQLVAMVEAECTGRSNEPEVIFSPQAYEHSHLVRVVQLIDQATVSIDIAMYSFRDSAIQDALARAVARGVAVRMVYETASADRTSPEGTSSARLESIGVNVRWINKVMHHKFMIVDGPQSSIDQARTATLITGSANWSGSAATRYDENTVVIGGNQEALLRFQREFNYLWANSRDFAYNTGLPYAMTMDVTDEMLLDDPAIDAVFTSANFRVTQSSTYGPTFSVVTGENEIADRLIELINNAQQSIHIASGHLRSRPVVEALLARHQANPDLDIRIYLDNQEYISASAHADQITDLDACLAQAGASVSAQQACLDSGFLFSYQVHETGIQLRYKYYCYRWDASYAPQMHDKYFIFDGRIVASGSYNLSDNAEHNTMENMVIYDASAFPHLVASFEENFESIWRTGEAEGLYDSLLEEIESGTDPTFPIVFPPMALTWDQVTDLKNAIRDHCPKINSEAYRTNAPAHQYCERG
jgi:phosphatidylserine/phosphatidylglycerophosphate/cardiolipin synthase-like enzyme